MSVLLQREEPKSYVVESLDGTLVRIDIETETIDPLTPAAVEAMKATDEWAAYTDGPALASALTRLIDPYEYELSYRDKLAFLLGDRSKYPGGLYPNEADKGEMPPLPEHYSSEKNADASKVWAQLARATDKASVKKVVKVTTQAMDAGEVKVTDGALSYLADHRREQLDNEAAQRAPARSAEEARIDRIQYTSEGGKKTTRKFSDAMNMPDVTDVSFPSMIGAIDPTKPKRKKKRPFMYKGVKLSRRPTVFEAKVLSLTEIPVRLDAAVAALIEQPFSTHVMIDQIQSTARYGGEEVLKELVRQGAIEPTGPYIDAGPVFERWLHDFSEARLALKAELSDRVERKHLPKATHDRVVQHLLDKRSPALQKRFARRAVNESFSFGRNVTIASFRRPHEVLSLAKKAPLTVDVVVQTAVMDSSTCDECALVDGEVMELGDSRQVLLHPPYVLCDGGDACRCVQIALLSDGDEMDVDELPDDVVERSDVSDDEEEAPDREDVIEPYVPDETTEGDQSDGDDGESE